MNNAPVGTSVPSPLASRMRCFRTQTCPGSRGSGRTHLAPGSPTCHCHGENGENNGADAERVASEGCERVGMAKFAAKPNVMCILFFMYSTRQCILI